MLKLREWMENGVPEYGLLSFGQIQELQAETRCVCYSFQAQNLALVIFCSHRRRDAIRTMLAIFLVFAYCLTVPLAVCTHSNLKAERDELSKQLDSERSHLHRVKEEYARTLLELQQQQQAQQAAAAAAAVSPAARRRRTPKTKSSTSKKKSPTFRR